MKFNDPLIAGQLIQRYKRFLVDIKLDDGKVITAVCPNTGTLKSCVTPGWKVMISESFNPRRKYRHTWEMVHNGRCWIGINTAVPNKIVEEAIRTDRIPELKGYTEIKREVKYGQNSRIDILLKNEKHICYVEAKNVTLVEEDGFYKFPDAVTERGRKHLYELIDMVQEGHRAVMFYVVQRSDGTIFKPAVHIDPAYADSLKEAYEKGVEILVYRADVTPEKIELAENIEWKLE